MGARIVLSIAAIATLGYSAAWPSQRGPSQEGVVEVIRATVHQGWDLKATRWLARRQSLKEGTRFKRSYLLVLVCLQDLETARSCKSPGTSNSVVFQRMQMASTDSEDQKREVLDFGSSQFFMSPSEAGAQQLARALDKNPTLVVGVDFLFWYAFGYPRGSNPRRMEGLAMGLKELERVKCHLIIGDLPNVDHALRGKSALRGGAPIIRRGQLPGETERMEMIG